MTELNVCVPTMNMILVWSGFSVYTEASSKAFCSFEEKRLCFLHFSLSWSWSDYLDSPVFHICFVSSGDDSTLPALYCLWLVNLLCKVIHVQQIFEGKSKDVGRFLMSVHRLFKTVFSFPSFFQCHVSWWTHCPSQLKMECLSPILLERPIWV